MKKKITVFASVFLLILGVNLPIQAGAKEGESSIKFYMENKEVVDETTDKNDITTHEEQIQNESHGRLPQTGAINKEYLTWIGIILLFVLFIIKIESRKKNEKI